MIAQDKSIQWKFPQSKLDEAALKYQPKLECEYCDLELKAKVRRFECGWADGSKD